jgi:hypothetical protein
MRQVDNPADTVAVHPALGVRQPIGHPEIRTSQNGGNARAHIPRVGGEQGDEGADRGRAIQRAVRRGVVHDNLILPPA